MPKAEEIDDRRFLLFRGKLDAQGRAEFIDAESTEVFVEVAQRGRQREGLDSG